MLDLFVDGDACPVKEETYKVALRHDLKVYVVSDAPLRAGAPGRVEFVRVPQGFNAADDWIAERAGEDDIVVTADIPLADRCIRAGARVVSPNGRALTEDSIGEAMARRELMDHLRQMGTITGGPPPFAPADRSRFLARLEETIQAIRRKAARR
ncbi:MAG TPA: YaiI/YqxD family protein [Candidatus Polarisedimenticolaceae bacterium]|nr:YaiI/YqxD family protein [Candidatus Polarisedimenticolaceae bacterium]